MNPKDVFADALLSEAAYADFWDEDKNQVVSDPTLVKDALIAKGFSPTQAADFIAHWKVIDHQPNTALRGFSATLFQRLGKPHDFSLAIRGTEFSLTHLSDNDPRDVLADTLLATIIRNPQTQSLEDYYQHLIETGKLSADQSLTVTGHSLGGYLAQLFAIDHSDVVEQAFTYNAPGIGGIVAEVAQWLGKAESGISLESIHDFYAAQGPEATAGLGTLLGNSIPVFIENTSTLGNHSIKLLVDSLAVQQLLNELDSTLDLSEAASYLSAATAEADKSLETVTGSLAHLLGVNLPTAANERETLYQQLTSIREAKTFSEHLDKLRFVPTLSLAAQAGSDSTEGLAYRYALEQLNPFAVVGVADLYAPHNTNGELDADQFSEQYLSDRGRFLEQFLRANRADNHFIFDSPYSNQAYADLASGVRLVTADALADPHFTAISQWPAQADRLIFGSAGADEIEGGLRDDHLYGQAGDDILDGGAGNDYLEGGSGNDLYQFESGNGQDRLFDSDGQGRIVIDGDLLSGGQPLAEGVWQSADGRHRYALDGDIEQDASLYIDGQLRVEHFHNGDLGITLSDDAAQLPDIPNTLNGTELPDTLWVGQLPEVDILQAFTDPIEAFAGLGNDLVTMADGNDTASGGEGNDWIITFAGDDHIVGEDGDDILYPGPGRDIVDGGSGNDLIVDANYRLFNTTGNVDWDDRIWEDLDGAVSVDIMPDLQITDSGEVETYYTLILPQDSVTGTDGSLSFEYTPESPTEGTIVYTSSDDKQHEYRVSYDMHPQLDTQPNLFSGGDGDDFIGGNAGDDILIGGNGNDRLTGGEGADTLLGGADDDLLIGKQGDDRLEGGSGTDLAYGGSGRDVMRGGEGDDQLFGDNALADQGGDDYLYGEEGDDLLQGNGGNDYIEGGPGNDELLGQYGRDTLDGNRGNDLLYGGLGPDVLFGGAGTDKLDGGSQDDWLYGGDGSDYLDGGDGNDHLDGGADGVTDTLFGGGGDDSFIYHPNGGMDLVRDGQPEDQILLQDILPEDLTIDTLSATDGTPLLSLSALPGNALLIAGGIDGGPDKYIFADGTRLSRTELLALRLEKPLSYQLREAGSLGGGSADDTLAGSPEDDSLFGQQGNDTLAGGAGDDYLAGGAGNDLYLIGLGTGLDTIDEVANEANRIGLLGGVDVASLDYQRIGDDLLIQLPNGLDGAEISDFFARNLSLSVRDKDGNQQLLTPDLLNASLEPTYTALSIDELRNGFIQHAQDAYGNILHVDGYTLQGDGLWHNSRTTGSTETNYSIGFGVVNEQSDNNTYIRDLNTFSSIGYTEYTTQRTRDTTSYAAGGIRIDNSLAKIAFVDLDRLESTGANGIQLPLDAIPVYGQNSSYNPLTGELAPEIIGYMVYPDGGGSFTQHESTTWPTVKEYDLQVNLLDLALGEGDDRFSITRGYSYGFNLVDGGSGDDRLDASQGPDRWNRQPYSIAVPGGNYWQWTQLPGSLLYGNEGDDQLIGSDGADELIGGAGNDYLQGGLGNDTYRIGSTIGMDVIYEDGHHGSDRDRLILPQEITFDDVEFSRGTRLQASLDVHDAWVERTTSLHHTITMRWDGHDGVTLVLPHADQQAGLGVDTVVFGDGTEIGLETLLTQKGLSIGPDPHLADNVLTGGTFLNGGAGNDILTAAYTGTPVIAQRRNRFDAVLIGGQGMDRLNGGEGNDLLLGNDIVADYSWDFLQPVGNLWDEGNEYAGGPGSDLVWGTAGSDMIHFNLGDGQDLVTDLLHDHAYLSNRDYHGYGLGDPRLNDWLSHLDDPAALNSDHLETLLRSMDTLRFGAGIEPTDLQITQGMDNALVFAHANGLDSIAFAHWFDADINQLGRIEFSDGGFWNREDIDALAQGAEPALLPLRQEVPVPADTLLEESPAMETVSDAIVAGNPVGNDAAPETVSDAIVADNPVGNDAATDWYAMATPEPAKQGRIRSSASAPVPFPDPTILFREPIVMAGGPDVPGFPIGKPIHHQWTLLQQAIRRLDAGEAVSASTDHHFQHGLGADVRPWTRVQGHAQVVSGDDPISLSPDNIHLQAFAGLSRGLQQLPW